jgi:hypothetical protein
MCDAPRVTDACRYCDAPIEWGLDGRRRRVPVEPHPAGTLILMPPLPQAGWLEARIGYVPPPGGRHEVNGTRYRRHREVCPARSRRR